MIHRKVTMFFKPENRTDFLQVFEESKTHIRNFPGCLHLQLIEDIENNCCICTSSIWESENDLENYRKSELFRATWAKTKPLFSDKPQAKSYQILHILN